MYQRNGEKSRSHGNRNQEAHTLAFWKNPRPPSEGGWGVTGRKLEGKQRNQQWRRAGWSLPTLLPRALRLLYKTWFAIFGRAKVACQSLVLQHCPPPQALGSSSSCSLMLYWEDYVFLLNITFPRDRGGQPVIRKPLSSPAFLLMLLYLHRNRPWLKALQVPI